MRPPRLEGPRKALALRVWNSLGRQSAAAPSTPRRRGTSRPVELSAARVRTIWSGPQTRRIGVNFSFWRGGPDKIVRLTGGCSVGHHASLQRHSIRRRLRAVLSQDFALSRVAHSHHAALQVAQQREQRRSLARPTADYGRHRATADSRDASFLPSHTALHDESGEKPAPSNDTLHHSRKCTATHPAWRPHAASCSECARGARRAASP
jgi:hypothetical protein